MLEAMEEEEEEWEVNDEKNTERQKHPARLPTRPAFLSLCGAGPFTVQLFPQIEEEEEVETQWKTEPSWTPSNPAFCDGL